jgi:AmmeMemoRadiSam system protein A
MPAAPVTFDQLTAEQERAIVDFAARALVAAVRGERVALSEAHLNGTVNLSVLGAFVTVRRRGRLRSCCGFLGPSVPLVKALLHAARCTASDDPRFPPIAARELSRLDIDVWLLSNQRSIDARGESRLPFIDIGKHGVQIARGESRGLLLPGVAVEQGLDPVTFLEHLCRKAGLPPSAWREEDTQLWTFEGRSIRAAISQVLVGVPFSDTVWAFSDADLPALAEYCRLTLLDFASGATPLHCAPPLPDGNVHGVTIGLLDASGRDVFQASRLSLRSSLPLQATLFNLTQSLAESLRGRGLSVAQMEPLRVVLSVYGHPALHGTVAEPDLEGLDTGRHMVAVFERNRWAALFDPERRARQLISDAASEAHVCRPEGAQVYAFEVLGDLPRLKVVRVPQPQAGAAARPPAAAGRFYPAEVDSLARLVDRCLADENAARGPWPAVMVPHAGLIYSGRIAGQTLRRVNIPSTTIIIGPKHTPHGVEWAVAPHETWTIPGASVASDQALARELCERIEGLELDAAAHAQEHAIEVELPLLSRLAPHTKVVGIAIGGGSLERCKQFAAALAQVIRSLPSRRCSSFPAT